MRIFSGTYFPLFRPNTEKHGPGKTPYLETFHAVQRNEKDKTFL